MPNPDMSIDERRLIQKEIESRNDGSWAKIASENDDDHGAVWFWVLVDDHIKARSAYSRIIDVLGRYLPNHQATKFTLSFIRLTEDKSIIIEEIYDADLRSRRAPSVFGRRAAVFKRQKHTVFDVDG